MTHPTILKGYTLALIKKIHRDDMIVEHASEVYNTLLDYTINTHPEFTHDEMDKCIYYAMQSTTFFLYKG